MNFIVFVKRDCETCQIVAPVLAELELKNSISLAVYSQDDPTFPEKVNGITDDRELRASFRHNIETVPTLIRVRDGKEVSRSVGWDRESWQQLTGVSTLGAGLPDFQPGCGSMSVTPGMPERLALKYGTLKLTARAIEVPVDSDPFEVSYERGWTDGLPVIPPTDHRVALMLSGTTRAKDEPVGEIPPNLAACTVEKVAINAVMAGCRPEYFPVVLAALEAVLRPEFSMHGLLATLWFSGPVIIVNGPVSRRIGMNFGGNALGQGNRANATIGRALQLLIRNVGGGIPGEIDRSILGNPGKYTFCFAEDESDPDWIPLNVARGRASGESSVTVFHGDGVQGVVAWNARNASELCLSIASSLMSVCHPKLAGWAGAILVLGPDHYELFKRDGWGRAEIEAGLRKALRRPGRDLIEGAQGIAEGIDPSRVDEMVDKFNDGYLLVVRAGGRGGGISGIIGGWTAQRRIDDVQIVTQEVTL